MLLDRCPVVVVGLMVQLASKLPKAGQMCLQVLIWHVHSFVQTLLLLSTSCHILLYISQSEIVRRCYHPDENRNRMLNSSVWQPAARGHRAYTDLSAARARGRHCLQPCRLGNDSLLNMVLNPLLDIRGGAPLCKALESPGG